MFINILFYRPPSKNAADDFPPLDDESDYLSFTIKLLSFYLFIFYFYSEIN